LAGLAFLVVSGSTGAGRDLSASPVWDAAHTRFVTGTADSLIFWRMQGGRPVETVTHYLVIEEEQLPAVYATREYERVLDSGAKETVQEQVCVRPAAVRQQFTGHYRRRVLFGATPLRPGRTSPCAPVRTRVNGGAACGGSGKSCG